MIGLPSRACVAAAALGAAACLALATTTATAGTERQAGLSATLAWKGIDADRVGTGNNPKPDGKLDGHFTLTLDTGGVDRTLTSIVLDDGSWYYDTEPQGRFTVLGVTRGSTRLNPADEGLRDPVSGVVTYDLWAADDGIAFSRTYPYKVVVGYADGTLVTSNAVRTPAKAAAPAKPAAAAAATTKAPVRRKPSAGPDKAQKVPDFWLVLSASVITRNTLGLGQDFALTVAPRNEQVLSVQVLERATGCLVEGVTVQLLDPDGRAVSSASLRTRAGLVHVGGLHLSKAGTYRVWAYATDAAGDVVMQSYLPLQVKDRRGQPFQTVNGRPFTYAGGEWLEGVRKKQSASAPAARSDLAGLVNGFLSILQGFAQSILGPSAKKTAATASSALANTKAETTTRLQAVQSKSGTVAGALVKGEAPVEARPGKATGTQVKLVGSDGASLIGNDGAGLIGNDGAGLASTGNGIVAVGGGNIVAAGGGNIVAGGGGNIVSTDGAGVVSTDGAGLIGRAKQLAGATARSGARTAGPRVGVCMGGYKTVGQGKVVMVDGSPVLARNDGKLIPNQIVIGGRNAMPVNGPKRSA